MGRNPAVQRRITGPRDIISGLKLKRNFNGLPMSPAHFIISRRRSQLPTGPLGGSSAHARKFSPQKSKPPPFPHNLRRSVCELQPGASWNINTSALSAQQGGERTTEKEAASGEHVILRWWGELARDKICLQMSGTNKQTSICCVFSL